MTFEIGDRVTVDPFINVRVGNLGVKADDDLVGTVCSLDGMVGVAFDEDIGGHDCGGRCEKGHGWYLHKEWLVLYETGLSSIPADKLLEVLCDES